MIALISRVSSASVTVDGQCVGAIEAGLLALVAVQPDDSDSDVRRMSERLLGYRVFADAQGRMNRSLRDVGGGLLLVSQFTLAADTSGGMRPSFTSAAPPGLARERFDALVTQCRNLGVGVEIGRFGAHMEVASVNDGPVTFWLNS